jgi:putative transposase
MRARSDAWLVMIGVRADGRKELIALADSYHESTESWADLLRDCARRGMRAPVLAVGDGAPGFWGGLREVFPEAREGRCWFHKTTNVLAALPKSAHPGAKKALAEIWGAEDKTAPWPRSRPSRPPTVPSSPRPSRRSPATWPSCWPCMTIRARTGCICARRTRSSRPSPRSGTGPRSPGDQARGWPGWPWRSKLIESAQDRWRCVNAPHLVALVRAGAQFHHGKLIEREQASAA